MKRMLKQGVIIRILFLLLTSLMVNSVYAQVTIGSGNTPIHGALLDIKSDNVTNGAPNATRGLLMPRVALTSRTNLFPMFAADSEYVTDPLVKADQDATHVGLWVYNTENENGFCIGLHIWDGSKWVAVQGSGTGLTEETLNEVSGTGTVKDHEGNSYPIAKFGNQWWTTTNLRTKSIPSICGPSTPLTLPQMGGVPEQEVKNPLYHYPQPATSGNIWSDVMAEPTGYQSSWGLLYNWNAATNGRGGEGGKECLPNEGGTAHTVVVQGICPNGWHLPSDKEWTDLENELIKNSNLYTSYPAGTALVLPYDNEKWGADTRGNPTLGVTFKLATPNGTEAAVPTPAPVDAHVAKSNEANARGFAALLVGAASMVNGAYKFGEDAQFMSSSTEAGPGHACVRFWTRYLGRGGIGVTRDAAHRYAYFSVRCVRN